MPYHIANKPVLRKSRSVCLQNRPLRMERLEDRTVLTTLFVTNGDDAGPGSFRDTIAAANNDPSVGEIVFDKQIGEIVLASSVEFTGAHRLKIKGSDTIIKSASLSSGTFDLFVSSGGADLRIDNLALQGGANGIFIPVPGDATGRLTVELRSVSILDNGLFGVHIDDQTLGSEASIALRIKNSRILGNGTDQLDFDGVRVDEGGVGNIEAEVEFSDFVGNGGDGLELDERGAGDVELNVMKSSFTGNGFFNIADLDDGLDVDEADGGSIVAVIVDSVFSDNKDEGLDLDEEHDGDVILNLHRVVADNNNDEGIKADEEGAGHVRVTMTDVQANGSESEEGIAIAEADEGEFYADYLRVTALGNAKDGIDVQEDGLGSVDVRFRQLYAAENGGNGVVVEEADGGNLFADVRRMTANNNGEFGLQLEQDTVGADIGELSLSLETFVGNTDGPLDLDGVVQI